MSHYPKDIFKSGGGGPPSPKERFGDTLIVCSLRRVSMFSVQIVKIMKSGDRKHLSSKRGGTPPTLSGSDWLSTTRVVGTSSFKGFCHGGELGVRGGGSPLRIRIFDKLNFIFAQEKYGFLESSVDFQFNALFKSKIEQDLF